MIKRVKEKFYRKERVYTKENNKEEKVYIEYIEYVGKCLVVGELIFHIDEDFNCIELATCLSVPYDKPKGFYKLNKSAKYEIIEIEMLRQYNRILECVLAHIKSELILINELSEEYINKLIVKGGE